MTVLLICALWVSAAWMTFGALVSIAQIGKERKPLDHGTAVIVVIVTAGMVTAMIAAALVIAGVL